MNLEVAKASVADVRRVQDPPAPLGPDAARLRIDAFALTTNNVTYAVFGSAMQYWDFFPTAEPDTWGRVPVWGFADVIESTSDACRVGERLYGFLPMGTELVVAPGRADDRGAVDVSPHRAPMAGAYNRYVRCATDPTYDATREAQQMLLFPLFYTSFVVDDFFADHDDHGTDEVVVSSASSKTAIGIAFLAHRRGRRTVGLTSPHHRAFVEDLGVYDAVREYADAGAAEGASGVYVDIAGAGDVRHAVHTGYGQGLAYSMIVGGTHWDDQPSANGELPGPRPEFFFAPRQIAKRNEDWGREELERRTGKAWAAYSVWTDGWLTVRTLDGADEVTDAWGELVAGGIDPRVGFVGALPREAGA